jgi:hypothetical protein
MVVPKSEWSSPKKRMEIRTRHEYYKITSSKDKTHRVNGPKTFFSKLIINYLIRSF